MMYMETVICIPFNNAALDHAGEFLVRAGLTAAPLPGADVTHLLLPVPSFDDAGKIRGGGSIEGILAQLPKDIRIIGGNLSHPALEGYRTLDLMQDKYYVNQNAAITAYCALKYIWNALPVTLSGQKILIIGWGRIGKCLARLLRNLDARITVFARKDTDRALAQALGYTITDELNDLSAFRVIVNTAPAAIVSEEAVQTCRRDCLKLDLASARGLPGNDVIHARGLPGKDAPESSGKLIAERIISILNKEDAL